MCPPVSSTVLHTDKTDDRYDADNDGNDDNDGSDADNDADVEVVKLDNDDNDGDIEVVKLESKLLQPRGLFSGSCNKRCNSPKEDEILS